MKQCTALCTTSSAKFLRFNFAETLIENQDPVPGNQTPRNGSTDRHYFQSQEEALLQAIRRNENNTAFALAMVDKLPRCFTLWLHPLVHLANDHLWCDGATQSESWQPFFSCLPQIYTFAFPTGPGVTYYCQWRKSTRIQNLKELEQNGSLRTRQLLQCFLIRWRVSFL